MATLQSQLRLTMYDGVTAKMRAISAQVTAFRARMTAATMPVMGMYGRIAALAGGYIGVTAGMRGTVGSAIKFEEAFADVRKVLDGTPEQLSNVRQQIIDLSKKLPTSAEGIASIYAAAAQSNIPIQELGKFSEMVAKVAVAWDTTEGDTSQALAEIKTQLNMNVDQIGLYADAINHLSNNTPARAAKLVEFSRRVAAQGEMFGFSAEQSLAFGAAMVSMCAEAEIAATSFRNMGKALTRGAGTKKEAMRGWKRVGLNPIGIAKEMQQDAKKTTLKVIEAIQKVAKHERADIAFALFGEEARALMPVINDSKELRRELDMVGDTANYAGSAFQEYMERASTTSNALQILRNKIAAVGREWGDSWLEPIKQAGLGIGDVLDTLDQRATVFNKIGAALKGFVNGLGYDSSLREFINDIGDLLLGKADGSSAADTLGRIFKQFQDAGKSFREFSDAYKDNPIVGFLKEVGGYGFTLFASAVGFSLLAGAVSKLAKALYLITGARAAVAILSTIAGLGGSLWNLAKDGGGGKGGGSGAKKDAAKPAQPGNWKGPWGEGDAPGTKPPDWITKGRTSNAPTLVDTIKDMFKPKNLPRTFSGLGKGVAGIIAEWTGEGLINDAFRALGKNPDTISTWGNAKALWDNLLGADVRDRYRPKEDDDATSLFGTMKKIWNWLPSELTRPVGEVAPVQLQGIPTVMTQPTGTQQVQVMNQQPVHAPVSVTVYATSNDAAGIANEVGARVKSVVEGYYADGM